MAEIALGAHLVAFVLFALSGSQQNRRNGLYTAARALLSIAAVFLAALLVYRSLRISFPALTGTYEGLVFLALAMDLFLVAGDRKVFRKNHVVLAAGVFAAFLYLALLSSPLVSGDLYPPIPVLRSYWLVIHVAFAFAGLALFTVSFVAAILGFLVRDAEAADRARDRAVVLGFVFYATGSLVFGAIWAESAWGRFWGWDPKETWALVTTLFYTGYLHLRYVRRVSQPTARILVIAAWILAGFTFWGVNELLTGLHSYA